MIRNFKRLQIQLSWQRKGKHKEVGYPRGHETFTWAPSSASPNVITHRTGHCPQLTSGVGRGAASEAQDLWEDQLVAELGTAPGLLFL